MRGKTRRTIVACWLAVSLGLAGTTALGQARPLYYSGFEPGQDYDAEFTLIEQDDWQGEGTGGNGLVEDDFEGLGQQGYIGYWPPEEDGEAFTSLWRPVERLDPEETKVTFTVLMMIVDSTNDQSDDFRWAVYNSEVQRLVTLDFDNETRNINYALDDNIFLPTGYSFEHEALYELKFVMDFAANMWTVFVGDQAIVNDKKTDHHRGQPDVRRPRPTLGLSQTRDSGQQLHGLRRVQNHGGNQRRADQDPAHPRVDRLDG
jgi:hypothetical protein